MAYRIGVDVGGTYTDAVALEDSSLRLIGTVKVPTTHHHPNGVSEGIRQALEQLIRQCGISPDEIGFIAHGTTQATNALLEGDVVPVGVLGLADGMEKWLITNQLTYSKLDLEAGKNIPVKSIILKNADHGLQNALDEFRQENITSLVVSLAYGVDHPDAEKSLCRLGKEAGFLCTAGSEMTNLYGLRIRTKTAIINASIMPRMLETAQYMAKSVRQCGISRPLMIMRSDGGAMSVDEVRERPVETILSGPAAGVAGALHYGNISEGIFFETGGTSMDISVVHNDKVMVKWARIGGHKTYVNSLDIRTVAIAGGSMLRRENGLFTCGPRSAHIAQLDYCCFAPDFGTHELQAETYRYGNDNAEYYVIADKTTGKKYAFTLTCLSNYAGYIQPGDFAFGNADNAKLALEAIARLSSVLAKEIAEQVFSSACRTLTAAVTELIGSYGLTLKEFPVYGGGGGCTAVGPFFAERNSLEYKTCPGAEVISPIGVAMAMIRETAERNTPMPTEADFKDISNEAKRKAIKSGAMKDRIEITVEHLPQAGIIRAVASGQLNQDFSYNVFRPPISRNDLLSLLRSKSDLSAQKLVWEAATEHICIFYFQPEKRDWFKSRLHRLTPHIFVVRKTGEIKLHRTNAVIQRIHPDDLRSELRAFLHKNSAWSDMGERLPDVFLVYKDKMVDYSMIRNPKELLELALVETESLQNRDEPLYVIACL